MPDAAADLPASDVLSPLKLYGLVVAGSVLIAVLLTVFFPSMTSFWENLVYSELIGLSICALTDLPRRFLWRRQEPPRWIELMVALSATIVGLLAGGFLAATLLGHPRFFLTRWIQQDQLGHILLISALGSLAYHVGFTQRRRLASLKLAAANERARAEAAQRLASEAQLGMLRAQIEPHMLFNTLANLRALIGIDPAAAQQMLDRLIGFMRATLSATRTRRVPLRSEFALLDDYLQLIGVRLGDRLRFACHLPEELGELSVLPLLLQPIVENAVRHGIEPAIDGGSIDVRASRAGNCLLIEVRNTGIAYRDSENDSATGANARGTVRPARDATQAGESAGIAAAGGFGLAQIRERLASAYGDEAVLHIGALDRPIDGDASRDGACVRIALPIEQILKDVR